MSIVFVFLLQIKHESVSLKRRLKLNLTASLKIVRFFKFEVRIYQKQENRKLNLYLENKHFFKASLKSVLVL